MPSEARLQPTRSSRCCTCSHMRGGGAEAGLALCPGEWRLSYSLQDTGLPSPEHLTSDRAVARGPDLGVPVQGSGPCLP